MNEFVINALSVIFGVWFLNTIIYMLFDIDLIECIHKLFNKVIKRI